MFGFHRGHIQFMLFVELFLDGIQTSIVPSRSMARKIRLGRGDDKTDFAQGVNKSQNVAILSPASVHHPRFATQSPGSGF